MKKFLLIIFVAPLLYCCSKKKDTTLPPPASLIGKWIIESDSVYNYTNGNLVAKSRVALPGDYYQFKTDSNGENFNSLNTIQLALFLYRYSNGGVQFIYADIHTPNGVVRDPGNLRFTVTDLSGDRIMFFYHNTMNETLHTTELKRTILLHKAKSD